jgi:hypothetical protein
MIFECAQKGISRWQQSGNGGEGSCRAIVQRCFDQAELGHAPDFAFGLLTANPEKAIPTGVCCGQEFLGKG